MKKLDKRVKWVLVSVLILGLLVPPGLIITQYFIDFESPEDVSMIDTTRSITFNPTPNSEIQLTYQILENQSFEHFLYQLNFTFDIVKGVEPTFEYNDRTFNFTQIYLTIMANNKTNFVSFFEILNMTKFFVDESQVNLHKEIKSLFRLDNLQIGLQIDKISDGLEGPLVRIGSGIRLFTREKPIVVDDIYNFGGMLSFWVNENSYNLSFLVSPDNTLNYTLNSSIGDLELYNGNIYIKEIYESGSMGIGSIYYPYAPGDPQGNYSISSYLNLSQFYEHLLFRINAGISWGGAEIEYEIIPYSQILAEQLVTEETRQKILWKSLLNYFLLVCLIFGLFFGCMVNYKRE